ncbi:PQQ-dependent sugar dehydrogenase [Altericroceibacterium xinjiangense]|uniref:PQQ-dependent sugar dehydrogenase n=1 Tax=Altericroceibacterium xinjiangense TaxID=762261 RepID=UPI0013DF83C0|nr:PQQ-dependent sugar dehydrogenase [Altericroceibacterium xinjiangense]
MANFWKHASACLALAASISVPGGTALAQDAPTAATPARPAGPPPRTALRDGPWSYSTQGGPVRADVVTKGLDHPWAMAFLPDGGMLVTERPGRLRLIRDGVLDPTPVSGLPEIAAVGIGGLYDIALDPDFARNGRIYFSYVKPDPANHDQTTLAVARAKWDGAHGLSDVQDILVTDAWYGARPWPKRCCGQGPASGSWGGRIAFDNDGRLFVATGDRNYGEMVQDQSKAFGKILRINRDGSVPQDNPFVGQPGWDPKIWSTGHRNPLGLFYDAQTGELWESEFGPRGGDEVNRIERGANYGWIDVTQGEHYNSEAAKGVRDVEGFTDPVLAFGPPSLNPGNVTLYRGQAFPQWNGNLLLASFTQGLLRFAPDASGQPVLQEKLLGDLKQRLRDVRTGPDGNLYILTDETEGALLKVSPGK